jgi:putative intracellular protease/amidase
MSKIAVLLTPDYADWECGYIMGLGRGYYDVTSVICTPRGEAVRSMGGLTVQAEQDARILDDAEGLVICGGMHWESEAAHDVGPLARGYLARGGFVAAICGGTLALARSGLLDDVAHTSNARHFLETAGPAYQGAELYRQQPSIADGQIITAPGTAPASFAANVFRRLGVPETAVSSFLSMVRAELEH